MTNLHVTSKLWLTCILVPTTAFGSRQRPFCKLLLPSLLQWSCSPGQHHHHLHHHHHHHPHSNHPYLHPDHEKMTKPAQIRGLSESHWRPSRQTLSRKPWEGFGNLENASETLKRLWNPWEGLWETEKSGSGCLAFPRLFYAFKDVVAKMTQQNGGS